MERKDGKPWTDDEDLRNWVRKQDPGLRVITNKSVEKKGAFIIDEGGLVLHRAESNSGLKAKLVAWLEAGNTLRDPGRETAMERAFGFVSNEARLHKLRTDLEYLKSGRADGKHPPNEIRRKIRDLEIEIKEVLGEI